MFRYKWELLKPKAITFFNLSRGSFNLTAGYKCVGAYVKLNINR